MSSPSSRPLPRSFPTSQCHDCAYLRLVGTNRGTEFLMCSEPTRPKYPPQPVSSCPVFEARTVQSSDPQQTR